MGEATRATPQGLVVVAGPAFTVSDNLDLLRRYQRASHHALDIGYELVDLVYKYYSQLDAKYKGLIPLRQVYIPETLTE